jgi:hypothetical protein
LHKKVEINKFSTKEKCDLDLRKLHRRPHLREIKSLRSSSQKKQVVKNEEIIMSDLNNHFMSNSEKITKVQIKINDVTIKRDKDEKSKAGQGNNKAVLAQDHR